MKTTILLAALAFGVGISSSQSLPLAARKAIDARFSHWSFRPTHIPNPCDRYGPGAASFPTVQKCNLNDDGKPDFGVAISTGRDSNLTEYFLALISNGKTYNLFMIDSAKAYQGAGERRLVVILAGDSTACFGGDNEVWDFGHPGGDSELIIFPVDALRVLPECESRYREIESDVYVFVKGRLLSFSTAD